MGKLIKEYRRVMLVLSYLCMLSFAFTLQSVPPVLPLIIKGLKLSHTQAGLLMGIYALPAIFLSIPAGMLSDRLGPFKIGIASLFLIIAGNAVFAVSNTFLLASVGRAVAVLGAAIIVIIAAHMLSQWYGGHGIGTAMGIFNTAMPVGTIICFTVFGRLGETLGWRVIDFNSNYIRCRGRSCPLSYDSHGSAGCAGSGSGFFLSVQNTESKESGIGFRRSQHGFQSRYVSWPICCRYGERYDRFLCKKFFISGCTRSARDGHGMDFKSQGQAGDRIIAEHLFIVSVC